MAKAGLTDLRSRHDRPLSRSETVRALEEFFTAAGSEAFKPAMARYMLADLSTRMVDSQRHAALLDVLEKEIEERLLEKPEELSPTALLKLHEALRAARDKDTATVMAYRPHLDALLGAAEELPEMAKELTPRQRVEVLELLDRISAEADGEDGYLQDPDE